MKPLAQKVVDYLEAEQIETTDWVALEEPDNAAVARIPVARILAAARTLDLSKADALILSACVQRRNTMADTKQFQQIQDATWDLINSYRETSQAVVDSLITLQDHNLKLAQSIFLNWMELLMQSWRQQTREQQEAFQKLASTPRQFYMDFFLAPLTLSHKLVEASIPPMQRERERERELVS
jgi:hypothetical protein